MQPLLTYYLRTAGRTVRCRLNYKKSIGEQKWIALFGQGLEAFAEWRRLDYPQLATCRGGYLKWQTAGKRFIYPGTEQSLNGDKLQNGRGRPGYRCAYYQAYGLM
jgi:hypothetical protein